MSTTGSSGPRPFVFVLMPFSEDFIDVYQLGIKAAVEEVGAYAERVDEQHFQESILSRIWNQIAKADVIVADMSNKNPNVFYEVGYAHALNKTTLLLTRSADDIPFDLKHWPHIVYGNSIIGLKQQLLPKLRWALGQTDRARQNTVASWNIDVSYFGHTPLSRSQEEAEAHSVVGRLDRDERKNTLLRFVIRNRGAVVSPVIEACYIWMSTEQAKLSSGSRLLDATVTGVPDPNPNEWLGKALRQYKVKSPAIGQRIPPGGFESITLAIDIAQNAKDELRLMLRLILDGVPQDYFLEFADFPF